MHSLKYLFRGSTTSSLLLLIVVYCFVSFCTPSSRFVTACKQEHQWRTMKILSFQRKRKNETETRKKKNTTKKKKEKLILSCERAFYKLISILCFFFLSLFFRSMKLFVCWTLSWTVSHSEQHIEFVCFFSFSLSIDVFTKQSMTKWWEKKNKK